MASHTAVTPVNLEAMAVPTTAGAKAPIMPKKMKVSTGMLNAELNHRRSRSGRLWLSSALSIPVDTFIFFGMIGALAPAVVGTAMASKFTGVTAVWLAMAFRARRAAAAS